QSEHRGLENLIKIVPLFPHVRLTICGDGELKKYVFENANQYENIIYKGSISYSELMMEIALSDIIVGLYYLSCKNHMFASPNKYYEHLAFGKPMITTKGTPPGADVERENTGWSIGDHYNDLYELISKINLSDIVEKGNNAHSLWISKYSNYYDLKVEEYMGLIK
ncbi:glycosyltransferase, partial [Vibrio mimicus]